MVDRPIIFSAPMVRALLAGTKSQTRRVLNPQPAPWADVIEFGPYKGYGQEGILIQRTLDDSWQTGLGRAPFAIGDILWVREAWRTSHKLDEHNAAMIAADYRGAGYPETSVPVQYEADGFRSNWGDDRPGRYRAAFSMPRWASRIMLHVIDVRVQRLQDISEDDARAEGIRGNAAGPWGCEGLIEDFADTWDSVNADRGSGWDTNPWVVAITFRIIAPDTPVPQVQPAAIPGRRRMPLPEAP